MLKLLGNPHRLQIAFLLAKGEQTNADMVATTGLSAQTFTHHLIRFRNRGFVSGKRDGRNVLYSLHGPKGGLSQLLKLLASQYNEHVGIAHQQ